MMHPSWLNNSLAFNNCLVLQCCALMNRSWSPHYLCHPRLLSHAEQKRKPFGQLHWVLPQMYDFMSINQRFGFLTGSMKNLVWHTAFPSFCFLISISYRVPMYIRLHFGQCFSHMSVTWSPWYGKQKLMIVNISDITVWNIFQCPVCRTRLIWPVLAISYCKQTSSN